MPTFDTPEPILVTLELGVGDVRIAASDRTDTNVEVRPTDPCQEVRRRRRASKRASNYSAGRLLIKAPKGWRRYTPRGGGDSIDVQIELPGGLAAPRRGRRRRTALHRPARRMPLHDRRR